MGQHESAIKDYDEALKLNPKMTKAISIGATPIWRRIFTIARSKILTR
jgi:hypothetical protein